MALADTLLPEFDIEMTTTRRVLERVADDRLTWKPHERSYSMGVLASHLANIPTWAPIALSGDSFDTAPTDALPKRVALLESNAAILEAFDRNAADDG